MSKSEIQCVVSSRVSTQCFWTLGILVSRWKELYLKYRFSTGRVGSYLSAVITGERVGLTFTLILLILEPDPSPPACLLLHRLLDGT